ncbi:septum formation family protein [Actinomadura citrea]|uniref:septum formation family protein n=1 Tax=Actinomadura citrea TaxID=46158 RepID=UPI003CE48A7E
MVIAGAVGHIYLYVITKISALVLVIPDISLCAGSLWLLCIWIKGPHKATTIGLIIAAGASAIALAAIPRSDADGEKGSSSPTPPIAQEPNAPTAKPTPEESTPRRTPTHTPTSSSPVVPRPTSIDPCSSTPPFHRRAETVVRITSLQKGEYVNVGGPNTPAARNYDDKYAEVTSCKAPHIGEVFYSGNPWPQSDLFPSQSEIERMSYVKCQLEFRRYVGIPFQDSRIIVHYWHPDVTTWANGDRRVVCIGYDPEQSLDYSIRGLRR